MKTSKKRKLQALPSILIMVFGLLLLVMKVYVDSEPGAIPLLLIVAGAGWYFFLRIQMRAQGRIE